MTRRKQRWYDWPRSRNAKTRTEQATAGAPPVKVTIHGPYAELYPDTERRLNEMLASQDPVVRRLADAYVAASAQRAAQRSAALKQSYGLTDAEVLVALHIMDGGAIAEYAQAHGVSQGTVRTQLKAIFAKTGVNRQAALARLGAELGR